MKLPQDRATRISLYTLLGLIGIAALDFMRSIMASGFMSTIGLIALGLTAPAMFWLAHNLGNNDVPQPATRQRNRDRFINK
jgi:hypothetical protein